MEKILDFAKQNYVLLILTTIIVILLITLLILTKHHNKKPKDQKEKIVVKKGVRYTKENNINLVNGSINVTYKESDILLNAGKKRTVTRKGFLRPGKYTVLSSEGIKKFNLRLGGFVKEFSHGHEIVLAEGDEITAISHSVILR